MAGSAQPLVAAAEALAAAQWGLRARDGSGGTGLPGSLVGVARTLLPSPPSGGSGGGWIDLDLPLLGRSGEPLRGAGGGPVSVSLSITFGPPPPAATVGG